MIRKGRILAILLVLAIITLTAVSCTGGAASDAAGTVNNSVTWEYKKDTATLEIKGTGVIDGWDSVDDAPWSGIRSSIKTVRISGEITKIGKNSFSTMPLLETAEIPAVVTEIGETAFAFCPKLKTVSIADNSNLQTLGKSVFEGCGKLEGIKLPAGVTAISERAFAFCSSLKYAVISGTGLTIENEAFYSCRSLETLLVKNISDALVSESAFKDAKIKFSDATVNETEGAAATLTVSYVYEDGAEPEWTESQTVEFGKSASLVSPAKAGYKADKLTVTETLYGKDIEVTVTYKKDEVPAETSAVTTAPAKNNENSKSPVTLIFTIVLFAAVVAGIIFLAVSYSKSGKKSEKNGANKKK